MKKIILIILLAAVGLELSAQKLYVEIISDDIPIKICPKVTETFEARATIDDEDVDAEYVWDFDNGDIFDTSERTINHKYSEGGLYYIKVTAKSGGQTAEASLPVIVGSSPYFNEFSNSVSPELKGICLGDQVKLKMPISEREITYNVKDELLLSEPESFYASEYQGKIEFRNFGYSRITKGEDIEYVSITLSAPNSSDIKLKLTSPKGESITLKDFGGSSCSLGEPGDNNAGKLSTYTFSTTAISTINSQAAKQESGAIASGKYLPEESFANLSGSYINGSWILSAETTSKEKECYVASYKIKLNDALIENNRWTIKQDYDLRRAVWSGNGVSATSAGIVDVTPQEYGTTRYTFTISDNLGCFHDTAVYVEVEKPSFSNGDSATAFIGDEMAFENTTSWKSEQVWSFGDDSNTESSNPARHAYYEKGTYRVIMQTTSESGCSDSDTISIRIVPRPLEVKEVNIFTPNGDGNNDVFTFFNPDESFLENGGLTKMPANIRSIKCKIYNSYGQTVCKWDNVRPSVFGWDGTLDNEGKRDCPPGTYYYDIIVFGKDGNNVKRSGTIYLYREK